MVWFVSRKNGWIINSDNIAYISVSNISIDFTLTATDSYSEGGPAPYIISYKLDRKLTEEQRETLFLAITWFLRDETTRIIDLDSVVEKVLEEKKEEGG